ncbi:MAG: MBL fold metallo-hydrolase [Xanthomonadales bacterium]|nr:MBL fold metallo-hydrolase [Xanthomonadales bacterium]
MRLTFWGTRGSLAKPGPDTVRYGGNTSCVQLESSAGTLVLLDCGTGAHALGRKLLAEREPPVNGHILFSHTHWDHIQGMPFFAPLFMAGNEWDIYGPHGFGDSLRETLSGQMQYDYFPVTLDALGADVRYHCLIEGRFEVGDIQVTTRYLNHPALTLGYRLEVDGAVVVYACDHEPHSRQLATEAGELRGQDLEHAEFLRDADLVIHDAQYTADEYSDRVGWGHSTIDYAVRVCGSAGVKRLALTHHDPMRDDDAVDRIMQSLEERIGPFDEMEVFAAAEGSSIELEGERSPRQAAPTHESAVVSGTVPDNARVLLAPDLPREKTITDAMAADGIEAIRPAPGQALIDCFREDRPSLVILGADQLDLFTAIRGLDDAHARQVPIVGVGEVEPDEVELTDWLVPPFSTEYARSRIRAWLLRSECRWLKAPEPADEAERLAALRQLDLLDSEPEERFDRITRLASELFQVPVALVSLVDADRQWFKSCVGAPERESSREVSFCAHAILQSEPLVVPDALNDDRFADNPVVADSPNVRFYAGCPINSPDGYPIGTLCVTDFRPHEPSPRQMDMLRDLAALVEVEVARRETVE